MAAAAARKSLTTGISCHAFNGDGSQVALSPNNHELHVYATNGSQEWSKWERLHVLAEHGGLISSVDWSAEGNAIVTCGHDRNAYVWKYSDEKMTWTPTLVICRLNRAATCVRWDPSGTKFAVASGSKTIAVCYYEASNDWYIAKTIKKHKSTVTSVAFSPNGKLLVTGCTDNKARICSAYVKGIDSDADDGFAAIFPNVHKFGEVLAEIPAGSWVNAVAWAPGSGHDLAFATHGSTVGFVRLAAGEAPAVQTVRVPTLPYQSMAYADENTLVAAGWSNNPAVYTKQGDSWALRELLDKEVVKTEAKSASKFGAARAMFAASASKGVNIDNSSKSGVQETKLNTRHQNSITSVFVTGGVATTAGVDGNIFYWAL